VPGARWLFERKGSLQSWPEDCCLLLEQEYAKWQQGGGAEICVSDYVVNFESMTQKNVTTSTVRKLHREETASTRKVALLENELKAWKDEMSKLRTDSKRFEASELRAAELEAKLEALATAQTATAGEAAAWSYGQGGAWLPIPRAMNEQVEEAHRQWKAGSVPQIRVQSGNYMYEIDFEKMEQRNESTGKSRPLQRESSNSKPLRAQDTALQQAASEVQHLKQALAEKSRLLEEAKQSQQAARANGVTQTAELASLRQQVDAFASQYDKDKHTLRDLNDQLQRDRSQFQASVHVFKQQLASKDSECDNLRNHLAAVFNDKNQLEADCEARHREIHSLQQYAKLRDAELASCKAELASRPQDPAVFHLKEELTQLKDQLKIKTVESERYEQEMEKLAKELRESTAQIESEAVGSSEAKLKKLREKVRVLQASLETKVRIIQRFEEGQKSKVEQLDAYEKDTSKLKKSNEALQDQVKAKESELKVALVNLKSQEQLVACSDIEAQKLQSEVARWSSKARTLEADLRLADGQLLSRLQKSLGVEAQPERTEAEVLELRDTLLVQIQSKGNPFHSCQTVQEADDAELQLRTTAKQLLALETQRDNLKDRHVKSKVKLEKLEPKQLVAPNLVAPDLYKIDLCTFFETNSCTKGSDCTFAHGIDEITRTSDGLGASTRQTDAPRAEIAGLKRGMQEFSHLLEQVQAKKEEKRQLELQIRKLQEENDHQQYREAKAASLELMQLMGENEFALKLLSPTVPTKEDTLEIASTSHLFKFVKNLMLRSVTGHLLQYKSTERCKLAQYEILNIAKCINPELSTRYKFEQMKLSRKHPNGVDLPDSLHAICLNANVGELALFHGCSAQSMPNILKQGFDFRIAGSNTGTMFGKGAYFAENASKSDLYSKPDGSGIRYMILAKVLVGKTYVAKQRMVDLVRPPQDEENKGEAAYGDGLYDSVMGERRDQGGELDHREFIVFHQNRAVPVAVIAYRHRPDCECNLCRRTGT